MRSPSKIAAATKDPGSSFRCFHAARRRPSAAKFDEQWLTKRRNDLDLETRREPGRGGPASAGGRAIDGLRDQRRAEESRHDAARARVSAQTANEQHPAIGERRSTTAGSSSFSFSAAIRFTTRRVRSRQDQGNEAAGRLAGAAKESARSGAARLLRGCDFGVEPMACSGGALSRNMGRRAHCRRQLTCRFSR